MAIADVCMKIDEYKPYHIVDGILEQFPKKFSIIINITIGSRSRRREDEVTQVQKICSIVQIMWLLCK